MCLALLFFLFGAYKVGSNRHFRLVGKPRSGEHIVYLLSYSGVDSVTMHTRVVKFQIYFWL